MPFIKKICVENLRNLSPEIIEFCSGINIIYGENGNGKTNILEAIFYLLKKKSFKKNTGFPQILSIDNEKPEIIFKSLLLDQNGNEYSYSGKVTNEGHSWFYNGQPAKKEWKPEVVFINPHDSHLFFSSTTFKRQTLDNIGISLFAEYKKIQNKYLSALKFRNILLAKRPAKFKEQINALDDSFIQLNLDLMNLRSQLCLELSPKLETIFKTLFNSTDKLELTYLPSLKSMSPDGVRQEFQKSMEKDILIGHTRIGAHRDDYVLLFNSYNAQEFCSLGQQKVSFLGLLFAYIELFRYKNRVSPILLLDDISGELDDVRWMGLLSHLDANDFQVMITTANEGFKTKMESLNSTKRIFVSRGEVYY